MVFWLEVKLTFIMELRNDKYIISNIHVPGAVSSTNV